MEPQTIGRYQLIRELGRGGMSTVYLAHDPLMKREVVVKVIPVYFTHDPAFRGRFKREAEVVASLEHSAVVPVYDFGEDNGQPYLVMRYMQGGSLADRIGGTPLPIDEIIPVLKRIGSALDYAHTQGIVHRDLKPGNILFDKFGEAYLADFGIARMLEGNTVMTATGGVLGTPSYMSPEQAQGAEVDGRSDLYSLGIIIFEMLTGRKPFEANTPIAIISKQIWEKPPRLQTSRPDLSPIVSDVLDKTLAKEANGRYGTVSSLIKALETAFHTPLPVKSIPPSIDDGLDKTWLIDETPPPKKQPVIPGEQSKPKVTRTPLHLKGWLGWNKLVIGLIAVSITLVILWFAWEDNHLEVIPSPSATATAIQTAVSTPLPPIASSTSIPTLPIATPTTSHPPTNTSTGTYTSSPTSLAITTETPSRPPTRQATLTKTAVPSSTPTHIPTTQPPNTSTATPLPTTTTPPPPPTATPVEITPPSPTPVDPTNTPVILPTNTPFTP